MSGDDKADNIEHNGDSDNYVVSNSCLKPITYPKATEPCNWRKGPHIGKGKSWARNGKLVSANARKLDTA